MEKSPKDIESIQLILNDRYDVISLSCNFKYTSNESLNYIGQNWLDDFILQNDRDEVHRKISNLFRFSKPNQKNLLIHKVNFGNGMTPFIAFECILKVAETNKFLLCYGIEYFKYALDGIDEEKLQQFLDQSQ